MESYYKIVVNDKTNEITKIKPIKWNGMDMTEHCNLEFYGYHECFYILPNRSKYYVSMSGIGILGDLPQNEYYQGLKKLVESKL